ncbi:MAG: class I tRNA ligase family protein, partial [Chloroflexota bacterium]
RFFTKAKRHTGVFDETAAMMQAHGRDPDAALKEPMIMFRNQGQILGAERSGDFIVAQGEWDGARFVATQVEVVEAGDLPTSAANGVVAGEIMRRTENVLQVAADGPDETVVEVPADATVLIPSIPGDNSVNQLHHHLEVQRMSKSKGNVVNPDELVAQYGADTVRTYLMFFAKWDQGGPWNYEGIKGAQRLIEDVWELGQAEYAPSAEADEATRALRRKSHQVIRKVTEDLNDFSFNTAVAALMELRNTLLAAQREGQASTEAWAEAVDTLLLLLAPIAPHITEELWFRRGHSDSVHLQSWPEWNEETAQEEVINLIVQVNGKVREKIDVPAGMDDEALKQLALDSDRVQKWLEGKTPRKVIVVRGTLVNIVV